jgi:KaiC/GvpD/RAD55 family RecA-like ATPase
MFPESYAVLVVGDPGAGMFEFCCYLGATYLKAGGKVVFLEANTSPHRVRKQMLEFGVDATEHEEDRSLMLIDARTLPSAQDRDPSALGVGDVSSLSEIFEVVTGGIEKVGGKPVSTIIDSLTPLYMHHDSSAMGQFFRDLTTMARYNGPMTAVVHKGILDEDQIALLASIADGLLEMVVDENFRRFVRIKHLKGTKVTPKWVPFEFERGETEREGTVLIWSHHSGKRAESEESEM